MASSRSTDDAAIATAAAGGAETSFVRPAVLDAGCGHGEVELGLADSGAEVFAMDRSSSIDDLARRLKRQSRGWRRRVHLVQSSVDRRLSPRRRST